MEKLERRTNVTFFISHGLAMNPPKQPARLFLESFRDKVFRQKPTSILIISGHWGTSVPSVSAISGPCDTIYDFDDNLPVPPETYKLKYPAEGSPELAKKVQELLQASGFPKVDIDKTRGLDSGVWVPLMPMYPEADIPICQLSVLPHKDATYHYNLGKALAPLKDEGVLIIGSGSTTHNLSTIRRDCSDDSIAPWADEFDIWLENALITGRFDDVNHYEERAPYGRVAHPSPEHIYPLHVAMGAAGEDAKGEIVHRSWRLHTLSYSSYKFTLASP